MLTKQAVAAAQHHLLIIIHVLPINSFLANSTNLDKLKKTVKSLFLIRFQHPSHQIHFFRLGHSIPRIGEVERGPDFEKSQNRPKSDKDCVHISPILCKLT
jgi:hypothetical protein